MEGPGDKIAGRDVEDKSTKSTIDTSKAIEDSDVKPTSVPSKGDGKSSDANEAKPTPAEDDGKSSDAKDTKPTPVPTEDDGKSSDPKDAKPAPVPAEDCGKSSDTAKSTLVPAEDDGKSSDVKPTPVPAEGDGKSNDAKDTKLAPAPAENDGESSDPKDAKPAPVPAEDCGKSSDTAKSTLVPAEDDGKSSDVKPTSVLSEDDEKSSDAKDAKSTPVPTEGIGKTDANDEIAPVVPAEDNDNVQNTGKRSPALLSTSPSIDHSTDVRSTVEDCQRAVMQGARPKTKSNVGENSEKTLPTNKSIGMPEFYKLGLNGSSGSKEAISDQDENLSECASRAAFVLVDESYVKPEGKACFNWFKKVTHSPQKLMSRLKRRMSPKAPKPVSRPIFSSSCFADDPFVLSPGLSPIGSSRHFVLAYLGRGHSSSDQRVDRIDYSKLAEDKIIPAFLGMHPCYDVMPTSGKVIVLSVELLVKNAFGALVANEIKAAPLWDTGLHDFVGMLTISDFINVLRHYFYSSPEDIKDIENQAIATWRRITQVSNKFIKINGLDSLAQATKLLIQEGVHRIPVFDEKRKCVLFVLTRKRLLQYLSFSLFENFEKYIKTPSFFRKTLRELKVGTFENIATTKVGARVIDALDLFVIRKVSSLPVVDDNGVLKDIFEKFDVFALAKEQTYHNLEMTVLEAITKAGVREGAIICTLDESLGTVINRFVNNKAHRIVVIDERRTVIGIISLSDILKFLVVQPLAAMEDSGISAASDIIEEGTEGAVGGSDAETSVFDYGEQDSSTDHLTEESDPSVLEAMTDLKISPAPENPEEKLDSEDVSKSE